MLLEFTPMPSPFPPTLAITWPQGVFAATWLMMVAAQVHRGVRPQLHD
jgi:hypothetical protein